MAVLLDHNSRVVVQGFGSAGQREALTSKAYGTKVVGGVTPGRGGQEIEGFQIRNTVREAVDEFDANVSLIFVPAPFAATRSSSPQTPASPLRSASPRASRSSTWSK